MFKIYTLKVVRFDGYEESNPDYIARFSTLDAAESAFRSVAERFNVEIDEGNVRAGYQSREWENDAGNDGILEITLTTHEVYESYAEEYAYSSRRLSEIKTQLQSNQGLRWN